MLSAAVLGAGEGVGSGLLEAPFVGAGACFSDSLDAGEAAGAGCGVAALGCVGAGDEVGGLAACAGACLGTTGTAGTAGAG